MRVRRLVLIVSFLLGAFVSPLKSQAFLKTYGKAIVNEEGDTIILRAMGLGGWMLQEGYMMQTSGFATAQYQIKNKIEALIGKANTDLFYEAWLANHVREIDIDSLKSWGFNAVRLPMHYNLFTLPVESEPVAGGQTWLTKGFDLTDSLIKWCSKNKMYVILDLHAAPGGQGSDQGISDYNPAKPSLWESAANQTKTISLWKKIAERYANEQWVGGYDLINETNWNMDGNLALKILYSRIAENIRMVDNKHLLFIEGNWFANDFTGLTPPFLQNAVYSPHKYWSVNNQASIQWVLDIRDTYNVPVWFGEAGENSNTWFRDAIRLLEDQKIGWAMWPMKKIESISGPVSVKKTPGYQAILDYWNGTGLAPSPAEATAFLMELAENLKLENCIYQKDVIDAMFRQVYSNSTIPFRDLPIPGIIYATDYDMGVAGKAYSDVDLATYHVSTGNYTAWNKGWAYRNDGVDIEVIDDNVNTNGYNVGWIETGEWMQYDVNIFASAIYDIKVRVASAEANGRFHIESEGASITSINSVQNTGGWKNWMTITIPNVILSPEDDKLKFIVDAGVFNLSSFEFVQKGPTTTTPASLISAVTLDNHTIQLSINKYITGPLPASPSGFQVHVNGAPVQISNIETGSSNSRIIRITTDYSFQAKQDIEVSYSGSQIIAADGTQLDQFTLRDVKNTILYYHPIPGKIQAEDFSLQLGMQLENTADVGGGQNIGYLDIGDYSDYYITVQQSGTYNVQFRTASESAGGAVQLELIDSNGNPTIIQTVDFPPTGGWQIWTSTTKSLYLQSGQHHLRLRITKSQFNINWFEFSIITSVNEPGQLDSLKLFPNPGRNQFYLQGNIGGLNAIGFDVYNSIGRKVLNRIIEYGSQINETINMGGMPDGVYFIVIRFKDGSSGMKRMIKLSN
jgi:endoglucanase